MISYLNFIIFDEDFVLKQEYFVVRSISIDGDFILIEEYFIVQTISITTLRVEPDQFINEYFIFLWEFNLIFIINYAFIG